MNTNLNAHHRRLCRLVDDSLRTFTDLAPSSLYPEIAKDLLVYLSQVYTRIRSWTVKLDADSCSHSHSGSEHETLEASHSDHSSNVKNSSHNGHQCMASILGHLMPLLSLPNRYIQHLTSNTLVTIFECDIAYENGGKEFVYFMCLCLKMTIMKAWSVAVGIFPMEANMSAFEASDSLFLQKLKLESADFSTMASILRVLRNILKLLQLNCNETVLKVFLGSIANSVFSWFTNEACGVPNGNYSPGSVDRIFIYKDANQEKAVTILQGNLLQLLCSLVDASSLLCDGDGSCEYCVITEIRDIIPKLLAMYIDKPENVGDARISEYLRHKILILMLRLSSTCHLENSVLVSWLQLINEYFHDLLLQPIEIPKSNCNTYLEGSPFGTDIFEAQTLRISSRHLQRLAVFLFLRCSLNSLHMNEQADEHFEYSRLGKSLSSDLNWNYECPPGINGLLELHKWLRSHLPAIDANNPLYFKRCLRFASCFLQLFMHEDDLLFQMLLQTLCVSLCSRQWVGRGVTSLAAKNDIFCLVGDIFNPINLFHLLLAEIFYDHQVLLDYLISNDTGTRCAEYLLKCLRMVCDAWNLFEGFPALFESLRPPCQKRRRVLESDLDLEDNCSVSDIKDNSIPSPLHGQSKRGHIHGRKHAEATIVSFGDAKDCLQSLKASISSLHQKKLFPYNPQVLIRRLSKIEEACTKRADTYVSSSKE